MLPAYAFSCVGLFASSYILCSLRIVTRLPHRYITTERFPSGFQSLREGVKPRSKGEPAKNPNTMSEKLTLAE